MEEAVAGIMGTGAEEEVADVDEGPLLIMMVFLSYYYIYVVERKQLR